ncbi:cob(I)yrinic acid a,c-diamide adenosyltransferase [Candidatus Protochlamydia phocaeensis]|uniref:cob(I)yrinic acid a,c-diamide adenosyltransferase n=1 Tax=Candidatus Protochlamydia phocaeensis TaxID=1414722 RepID=UPI0008380BB5|nr:cob(I)yrinic acid a,c-diamide adenosyltransferase [Candidatus Protochlamydia phocaeensis]
MKIYTRTGDKGQTSLFSGERVNKDNPFIDALGTIDEGNSALGLALSFLPKESELNKTRKAHLNKTREQLEIIQHALFDVGAALATPRSCDESQKLQKTRFGHEATDLLEKWIDEMDGQLPPLKNFILPGGHPVGAALHLSRSIIRRAERLVIPLYSKAEVTQDVLVYLNRLSDYLFVTSRFVNHCLSIPETEWQPHKMEVDSHLQED